MSQSRTQIRQKIRRRKRRRKVDPLHKKMTRRLHLSARRLQLSYNHSRARSDLDGHLRTGPQTGIKILIMYQKAAHPSSASEGGQRVEDEDAHRRVDRRIRRACRLTRRAT
jgi:hypothetical protein